MRQKREFMLVGAPGFSEISPGERVSRLVGTGEGVNALIIAPKRCPVRGVARCDARRRDAGYAVNSDASLPLIRLLPSPCGSERKPGAGYLPHLHSPRPPVGGRGCPAKWDG